ncbi:MAG: biopolymer transporter ExbD [Acidobacteria bacterium]|nr:biopolymer transporter ExbD [Acidobacteriota bacterium]
MSMQVGGEGSLNSEINVTPMVDVMLVLLIIFMVVTPFLQQGVSVTLPKGPNSEEDPAISKESSVVVAIPIDGTIYVGRELVSQSELETRIRKTMETKPIDQRIVYVKADNRVRYDNVVSVIDGIRSAGIDRVGLVVDPGKRGQSGAAEPAPAP